eukprot:gene13154-biopygen10487
MYKLMQYEMYDKSHTIVRLAIHLPDQHAIYFTDPQHASHRKNDSMLMPYFTLNQREQNAHQYIYQDIPEHYTFNKSTKQWQQCKRRAPKRVIGRIYKALPLDAERFALRLILLHRKGATSFKDIRTVDGVTHDMFKNAARAMSLLEDNAEHRRCLQDAAMINMPAQMRTIVCNTHSVSNSKQHPHPLHRIPRRHGRRLCQTQSAAGFKCNIPAGTHPHVPSRNPEQPANSRKIPQGLPRNATTTYHLCTATTSRGRNQHQTRTRTRTTDAQTTQPRTTAHTQHSCPRHQQTTVSFSTVQQELAKPSTTHNPLLHNLQASEHKVKCVAYSGIAATLLIHGKTAHLTFQIQIPLLDNSTCNVKAQSLRAQQLQDTTLFVWDEASVIPATAFKVLGRLLRDITKVHKPFGRKYFVLGGDFRPVLPVMKKAGRERVVQECLKSRKVEDLWSHFQQFRLITNMRAVQDATYQAFTDWLLRIGNGVEPHNDQHQVTLPQQTCIKSLENLMNSIYPQAESAEAHLLLDPNTMLNRCCLTPKNQF